jgi:2-phosphosulfolactate phosphatase
VIFNQHEFDISFEWGENGAAELAPISQAVIMVDVLSFSTVVDIAVGRGAVVFPYRVRDAGATEFAESVGAILANPFRTRDGYSLSPESLLQVKAGTRLVLPSPNGSTLSLTTGRTPVFAGCLRNARAVAVAASRYGSRIAVIAAGERWRNDYSLRPSFEDLIGAGAIISYLSGSFSPEAVSAVAAFRAVNPMLLEYLRQCGSGKELIEHGFSEDIRLASQLDASDSAPILVDGAFINGAR